MRAAQAQARVQPQGRHQQWARQRLLLHQGRRHRSLPLSRHCSLVTWAMHILYLNRMCATTLASVQRILCVCSSSRQSAIVVRMTRTSHACATLCMSCSRARRRPRMHCSARATRSRTRALCRHWSDLSAHVQRHALRRMPSQTKRPPATAHVQDAVDAVDVVGVDATRPGPLPRRRQRHLPRKRRPHQHQHQHQRQHKRRLSDEAPSA